MAHIAMMAPASAGHLNPLVALGRALVARGHRITVVAPLDARPFAEAADLEFVAYGERDYPLGATDAFADRISRLSRWRAGSESLVMLARVSELTLREAPALLRGLGVDGLVADSLDRTARSIAEHVGIPWITSAAVVSGQPDAIAPPFSTTWRPARSLRDRARNRMAYRVIGAALTRNHQVINRYRRQWRLAPQTDSRDSWSPLAVVCQAPPSFDFPREISPPQVHRVGPMIDRARRPSPPFPFEQLSARPLVYASLGTRCGESREIFSAIASAAARLNVQLVVSLGRCGRRPVDLPGAPLICDFVPQLALLERAALTVTHGGINTTLESLAAGVPLIAIPLGIDQPGVAARISWSGVGEYLPRRHLSSERFGELMERVLTNDRYRLRAAQLQQEILDCGGAARAAAIVERAVESREPVLSCPSSIVMAGDG